MGAAATGLPVKGLPRSGQPGVEPCGRPFYAVNPLLGNPWLRDIGQMGSLAGAAYLLNFNAGVLRHVP